MSGAATSAVAKRSKHSFAYGDESVADHGWGCVYRNIQTALHLASGGSQHISMGEIAGECEGIPSSPPASGSVRSLWIEPIDGARILSKRGLVCRHYFLEAEPLPAAAPWNFTRTAAPPATERVGMGATSWLNMAAFLGKDERHSIIIDDGIMSFIVIDATVDEAGAVSVLIADPHTPDERQRWYPVEAFFTRVARWAICEVAVAAS